jgi:hypothetical protein
VKKFFGILAIILILSGLFGTVPAHAAGGKTPRESIKILSPIGGETFSAGGQLPVAFSTKGIPAGTHFDVFLQGAQENKIVEGELQSPVQNTGITLPTGIYQFPQGKYKIKVVLTLAGKNYQDSSNFFRINQIPGRLVCSVDPVTPYSKTVHVGTVGGAQEVDFSWVKLAASSSEAVKVSRIEWTLSGGRDSDFGEIYLYIGSDRIGTSYILNGKVIFAFPPGLEIYIPAASYKTIRLKANLMGVLAGTSSGDCLRFYIADCQGDIDSLGASSCMAITETEGSLNPENPSNFGAMTLVQ